MFKLLLRFLCFLTVVAAGIVVVQPKPGAHLKVGRSFTVQVEQPNSIQGPIQVALVIGLQSCPTTPCVDQEIGSILYNGPFDPEFHNAPGRPFMQPYQNFTVTVPSFASKGNAVLEVLHVGLIGAGPFLLVETPNVTVHIV